MTYSESLERRVLRAADPIFDLTSKGTLNVFGTADADNIVVDPIHDNPLAGFVVTVSPESTPGILHQFKVRYSAVKRFRIEGGDGGDAIYYRAGFSVTKPVTILGQGGDDTLAFFSSGPTLADGGDGNDYIGNSTFATFTVQAKKNRDAINDFIANDTPGGASTLLGGDGDDTLVGDSNDQIDGGAGNDTAQITLNNDVSTVLQSRADALAHDYYLRLGALNLETYSGTLSMAEQ